MRRETGENQHITGNNSRENLGALFFAVLMVLSMVAMATPALANDTRTTTGNAPLVLDEENFKDADQNLTSQKRFWQGQELYFQDNETNAAGNTWELHKVTRNSDNNRTLGADSFVREMTLNENSTRIIKTSGLSSGEYVVLDDSGGAVKFGGTAGNVSHFWTATNQTALDNSRFTISVQSIESIEWDDASNDETDTNDLEIESNRANYDLEVYAEGFDSDDLTDLFNRSNFVRSEANNTATGVDFDEDVEDDNVIIIQGVTDDDAFTANFSDADIDPGDYTFEVEVHDKTASGTADVTVTEEDVELNFAKSAYQVAEGDE